MRVFLTGGTGLIGSHVAEALRGAGHEVVALQRERSNVGHLRSLGCRVATGDVREGPDLLARHVEGADAVVHGAALVYAGGTWPRTRAVNVEGTTHVLEAAVRAGVPLAVHLSSVAVYGHVQGPVDEDSPADQPLAPGDLYGRSKREAEVAAREVEAASGLAVVIVRPSAVYGERDRLFTPKLGRLARLPVVPLMGSGTNHVPVVYAGNVASAVVRALEAAPGVGATYNLGTDRPLTQRALLEGIADGLGRTPRFIPLPDTAVRAAARAGEAVGLTIPGAGDLTLTRFARLSLEENPYRSERIRTELGWSPPIDHNEGLRRAARWFDGTDQEEQ